MPAAFEHLVGSLDRQVYVYHLGTKVEWPDGPSGLSGDPVLPGFVLDLRPIWEAGF